MNIKCIALDLDRTTLNASGRLSDGNYNALCHAIENGVHIVIASGRSFDTLPKDVLAVPGIEYAITMHCGTPLRQDVLNLDLRSRV